MADDGPFDLERFVSAQADVIERVRAELQRGRKQSHWMWFVFPQLAGLGSSPMANRYAIASLAEARRAYLVHPLLGARLRECTELVLAIDGKTAHDIFGAPDDLKFRSCLTLFAEAGAGRDRLQRRAREILRRREGSANARVAAPGVSHAVAAVMSVR